MKIKVLQFNSARSVGAISLACTYASTQNMDLLIISEPNVKVVSKPGWFTDIKKDVAIKIVNPNLAIRSFNQNNEGFVSVKINGISYYSCYISPNCSAAEYENFLDRLKQDLGTPGNSFVVAGDFNAKSMVWGGKSTDSRGNILLDWIAGNNATIQNHGNEPTFRRNSSSSIIDLTITSENIAGRIAHWKVMEEETLSDHMYINFEVNPISAGQKESNLEKPDGWKIDGLERFIENFKRGISTRKLQSETLTVQDVIEECTNACNRSFAIKKRRFGRQPAYWWNSEIAAIRKACLICKRIVVRSNRNARLSPVEKQLHMENYKRHKKMLKNSIVKSKTSSWKKVCDQIDEDIWGLGYKIVMKNSKMYPMAKLEDSRQLEVANTLFPPETSKTVREEFPCDLSCTPFELDDLKEAISRIKNKRAPGPDRIPPEIAKAAAYAESVAILQVYNTLIMKGEFPKEWKKAKLVLIQKPGSLKYRPICLLDVFGKLFERLIADRVYEEVKDKIYIHQYGFRRGRSTIDAMQEVMKVVDNIMMKAPNNRELCVMATIDIRNAFNSAPWDEILLELKEMGVSGYLRRIISNYLSQRCILIGNGLQMSMECGVPQGSILGPLLWNIFYNQVLKVQVPSGTVILGFADDTAVISKAKTEAEVISNINWVLLTLSQAISKKRLKIAPEKTEAIILYGGRKFKQATLQVENIQIQTTSRLRYLGVTFDHNCQMKEQVVECTRKAEKTVVALSRVMPNLGGPKSSNRRTLSNVAHSILLYAAPVWSRALQWNKYRKLLERVQRRMALRICCGFRTMSTDAALVLAGLLPIDIQIRRRCQQYGNCKDADIEEGKFDVVEWQQRWENLTDKAEWTKHLIPDIEKWTKRKHGEIDYYLTQMLSGHGWFNGYRKRFHLHEDDQCSRCQVLEDADHVFFRCEKWRIFTEPVSNKVGTTLTAENCIQFMLKGEENWKMVATMARHIVQERVKET